MASKESDVDDDFVIIIIIVIQRGSVVSVHDITDQIHEVITSEYREASVKKKLHYINLIIQLRAIHIYDEIYGMCWNNWTRDRENIDRETSCQAGKILTLIIKKNCNKRFTSPSPPKKLPFLTALTACFHTLVLLITSLTKAPNIILY